MTPEGARGRGERAMGEKMSRMHREALILVIVYLAMVVAAVVALAVWINFFL